KSCTKKARNNPDQTLAKVKELKAKNAPSPEKSGHKPEEQGRHDHNGHQRGEHKHHGHGERHGDETPPQGSVKIGDKVPDFSVRTLDGKSIRLSELQKDERRTKNGVVVAL